MMYFYIHNDAIVYKTPVRVSNPGFIYNEEIHDPKFGVKDQVVYEGGKIVLLEHSDMYKGLSGQKDIEEENKTLKIELGRQKKFVSNMMNSFDVLDGERRALFQKKQ